MLNDSIYVPRTYGSSRLDQASDPSLVSFHFTPFSTRVGRDMFHSLMTAGLRCGASCSLLRVDGGGSIAARGPLSPAGSLPGAPQACSSLWICSSMEGPDSSHPADSHRKGRPLVDPPNSPALVSGTSVPGLEWK